MALRALAGKLRGVLGRHQAASGTLTHTCEHCGKPSSGIAKKCGDIDDFSAELRRSRLKHYMVRTIAVASSAAFFVGDCVSWCCLS